MRHPLPADLAGRPFTVAEALAAGVTSKRLRSSDLSAPFWGVRDATGADASLDSFVTARGTRMPNRTFFSHQTAAQLWSIPLPSRLAAALPLHVSSDGDHRGPVGKGTIGHHIQIAALDVVTMRGVRLTSLERTVLDLSAALSDEELLGALDNILWRRRPPDQRATARSIADALTRYRGRRGRGRLLELTPLATSLSDSIPESIFRLRFRRAGLPPALPNAPIVDARGRFVALPDLQFEKYLMCFDYEGDHHRTEQEQWRKDLARVPRLQDLGWHHTRLSAADLAQPNECLERARRNLIERGWNP